VNRFDTEKLKDNITQQRYYGILQENWRKAANSQMETVEKIWKEIRHAYNATAQDMLGYTKRQKEENAVDITRGFESERPEETT